MNRSRNILLWIITAIFYAGAMFFLGTLQLWIAIVGSVAAILVFVVLLSMKPEALGLKKERTTDAPMEVFLPGVFPTEIRLIGVDLDDDISILINKQDYTIGRSAECDFVIDPAVSKKVSRRHIRIHYNPAEGTYAVIAFETSNGTRLNHTMIQANREYVIKKGDSIELADVRLKVDSAYY